MKYLRPTLGILFCFLTIYVLLVHKEFQDCILKHRGKYLFLVDRDRVHRVCWENANPFFQ